MSETFHIEDDISGTKWLVRRKAGKETRRYSLKRFHKVSTQRDGTIQVDLIAPYPKPGASREYFSVDKLDVPQFMAVVFPKAIGDGTPK